MLLNLKAATFEVLETMFYLLPEIIEEPVDLFRGKGIRSWVAIIGPQAFRVGLTIPVELAQEMAGNFLGTASHQVSEEHMVDTVKEAANMVAGAFLAREEVAPAFHLLQPQAETIDLEGVKTEASDRHLLFAVEDYGVEVFLERVK